MALRSHVTHLQNQVLGQLALDVQVVLGRILRPQVRLKLPVEQNRAVERPVHWLSPRRIENPVKRIGFLRAVLLLVGRVEQRSIDDVAAAERRLGAELLQHQLLHRVIEKSPTCADAGLAGIARTPGNSQAGSKSLVISAGQASRNTFVAGHDQAGWNNSGVVAIRISHAGILENLGHHRIGELAGINRAHLSGAEALDVLADVGEGSKQFPAQPVIQG